VTKYLEKDDTSDVVEQLETEFPDVLE